MTNLFDFFNLIQNEVASLLNICPSYISTMFVAAGTFSLVLAIKRAVVG